MKTEIYEKMFNIENKHWWFVSRRKLVESLFHKYLETKLGDLEIVDVGCGTGATTSHLRKFGKVTGIEPSSKAISYSNNRGLKGRIIQGIAEDLPFNDGTIDVICLLDVIEHLRDDNKAIKEALRVLKANGLLILTVPAFMSLWSPHDIFAGHYRRYNKKDINKLLVKNNCNIKQIGYWNMSLFVPLFLFRKLKNCLSLFYGQSSSDLYNMPHAINAVFKMVMKFDNNLVIQESNVPFGSSIVAISKKIV